MSAYISTLAVSSLSGSIRAAMSDPTSHKTAALKAAKNLRSASEHFQLSIAWAVGAMLSNPTGINCEPVHQIFRASGFLEAGPNGLTISQTGLSAWRYITDAHGLGLGGLIRWDDETSTFKSKDGWKDAFGKIDLTALIEKLVGTRWNQHNKKKASSDTFNVTQAVLRLVKNAQRKGVPHDEIQIALRAALKVA